MVIEAIEKSQKGQGLKIGQFKQKTVWIYFIRYDLYGINYTEKSVFKPRVSH